MRRKPPPPKRRRLLRQLEERLLFTAVPFLIPEIDAGALDAGIDFDAADEESFQLEAVSDGGSEDLRRHEVVIIDSAVDDYETLIEDLAGDDASRELLVLVLDSEQDALDQIGTFLADKIDLDAIHLISHGDDATLRLGDLSLNFDNLDTYAGRIASWNHSLADGADLLLYGCDVAGSDAGRGLAESLAALTGADVAASDDLTGHESLGGDWVLEYATGSIEATIAPSLAAQSAFMHVLADADPSVTVSINGSTQPGSNATINLSFDNTGLPGDTGFGPFIDVLIPKMGADGIYDGDLTGDGSLYDLSDVSPADGQADGEPDGLILPGGLTVMYQGLALNSFLYTFGDDDGVGVGTTGTIAHPYAVDTAGNPLDVVGEAGDQLLVIELPFGSFATDQPVVDITIDAPISPLADIGTPLTVWARGGFRYGNDALNNPATDPSLLSDVGTDPTTWAQSDSVTPTALVFTKSTSANGEGATGPNWLQTFTIDVDIPTGQVLTNFVLTDLLPDNIQFSQITGVSVGGALNAGVNFTTNVNDTDATQNYYGQDEIAGGAGVTYDASLIGTYGTVDPTAPQASDTLAIVADSGITGYAGTDITVTVTYFVPDKDAAGDWVVGGNNVDSDKGEDDPSSPEVSNTATVTGSIAATDLRDMGGPVSENDTATLDTKSIAIQKGVTVVGGGIPAPGQLLEWTLSFELSDYYTYGNLQIDDLFSDGQLYFSDAINKANFTVTDRGVTRSGDFTVAFGSVAAAFDGTNTFVVDQSRHDTVDGGPGDPTGTEVDNPGSDGQTAIKMFLSEALISLGDDGILEGDLADDGTFDGETATGTITFYTEIQEDFVDPLAGEDRSVDQGDTLSNSATLTADNHVNRVDNPLMPSSGHNESDTAAASTTIPVGALTKQLHAINGDTAISGDLNITSGDRVTYRLTYNLPTTDFEDLVLTDFFPMPVFDVADPDGDGYTSGWVFDADTASTNMGAGVVELLGTDTFYNIWDFDDDAALNESVAPTISIDTSSNSLSVDFGTFDGATNGTSQVDLLVTVTVGDTEFADGLFLTNMALASEASTGGSPSSNVDLVQIELSAPELEITKGIVSTSVDATAVYGTSAVANELQQISGSAGGSFTITFEGETTASISGTATAAEVRDALETLTNVEAGDVIVSGDPIGGGTMRVAFIGQYEATDITFSVSDPGLTATELIAGGSAITESSRAAVWGLPGAGANTAAIDAASIAALPIDGDVSDLDGRDQVKYAVTIRNVGGADAYDISLTDLLPAGLEVAAGGLNLNVYDVAGNQLTWTALGPDPLVDGIRINDPIAVYAWADDGFDRLVKMDSRDNFDNTSNAAYVGGVPTGIGSIEAMALDPSTGTLYAIDEDYLGTVNLTTGAFTPFTDRIDADISPTISDADAMSFHPVTGELWAVDSSGNELIKIDTTTGKAIVGAFGTNDYLTVPGGKLDDIAIDFAGTIFADSATALETLTVNESTGTVTRNSVGNFMYGATNLNDMEGISIDLNGRLWGTTGNSDSNHPDQLWEIDKATGTVSNPRDLAVGGDYESVVAFDPNHSGSATFAGYDRDTLIITYDVQVADSGTVNTTYLNNASLINYGSVDGGANFVTSPINTSAQITTADISLDTFIVDSSESHTGFDGSGRTEGAIGEIIRYRVEMVIPEGTYIDTTLREILPPGLRFIDDGTAQVAFVSDGGSITSTDIIDAAAFVVGNETTIATINPVGDFGDEDVANSLNGFGDVYNSGTDVYFRFGDVVNTDNDANLEYVVLEFNALVDNHVNNNPGTIRSHRSRLYENDATDDFTPVGFDDQVRVVEPQLNVDSRVFSTAQVDGGDVFNVTVTLSGTAGANFSDAFDLVFTEDMPTGFTRTGAVTVTGGSYSPVVVDSSTGSQVNLAIDSLPEGDTITVTYQVTTDATLPPAGTHSFGGDLTWTSLPGLIGTTGAGDPTGSDPGTSGDPDGERTGNATTYAHNDYSLTDSDNLAGRPIVFTKTLIGTELANDIDIDGIDDQAVIGEVVTYQLRLQVPDGEATGLVAVDTLDPGLAYIGLISVLRTDDLQHVGGAPINAASITTTIGAGGQMVTFDIGDVWDPTPNATNDIDDIYITYQAVVLDVAGNQGDPSEVNTLLNNSATLSYDGGSNITVNAAEVEVIEPELTTTLDVYGSGGVGDTVIEAGEAMTVVSVLSNASGVAAYDVYSYLDLIRLDDGTTAIENSVTPGFAPSLTVVDSAGIYTAADFEWVDPDLTASPGSDLQGWRLQVINPAGFDIDGVDPLRTITFTVTGTAVDGVDSGETYTTPFGAEFTSMNGPLVDRSIYSTDSDERTYDSTLARPQDDYLALSTADVVVSTPTITKSLTDTEVDAVGNDDTQAVIGELVTYTIDVSWAKGDTHNVVVTDTLDAGLAFVGMTSGGAPTTVSADGKTLTWNLGDIFNDPGPIGDDGLTFVYEAVVLNNAANNAGTQIGELAASAAVLTFDLPGGSPGPIQSDHTTDQVVTVVEAALTTTSTMTTSVGGDQIAEAGETVTYTATIENTGSVIAHDVNFYLATPFYEDDLAVRSPLLENITFVVDDSADVFDDSGDMVTPGTFFQFATGANGTGQIVPIDPLVFDLDPTPGRTITITVTGTVRDEVAASESFQSWHVANWTSLDGLTDVDRSTYNNDATEKAEEREYDSGYAPDDYSSATTETLTTPDPVLNKTLTTTEVSGSGNDHTQAVVGELVTYTLTVDLPQGITHNVSIADIIDPGMALHDVVSTSHVPTGSSLAANNVSWDFGDVANDPAVGTDNQLTIVYRAVVLDVVANQTGTQLGEAAVDQATLTWDDDGIDNTSWTGGVDANSFSTTDDTTDQIVTVVEPTITVTRDAYIGGTPGPTTGDAGDAVTYVITMTNSSGVDAFDVSLSELLPTLTAGSAVLAPTFTITGTSPATAVDFQWAAGSSDATSWELEEVPAADIDLAAGQTLTITIDGTLSDDVLTGLNVTDDVTVAWTSIDDDLTTDDASTVRSAYSPVSTERTGSDGEGVLLDNYADESIATVTINYSTFTKTVFDTSLTETGLTRPGGAPAGDDATLEDVAIGEYITYHLTYTAAEGISDNLNMADATFDATGQRIEILSAAVINIGSNLSFAHETTGAPLSFVGETDVTSPRLTLSDIFNADGVNDYLLANMGDVTNVSDGVVDAKDQFVIEVVGRAIDHAANQNDTLATPQHGDNYGWFGVTNPNTGFNYNHPFQILPVEIVTPDLTFSKSIDKSIVDTGETVTVTLTATNNGNASAYQVQIEDVLDASEFDLSSVNVGISGTDYPADFTATYTVGTGTLVYDFGQLDAGETSTFVFTVNVADDATAGSTIENLGSITFASTLPSGHINEADARTYGDTNAVDDTALDDTDSFDVRENTISGMVYFDADLSGSFNVGDTGIDGVTMTLTGTDHLGNAITPIVFLTEDGTGTNPLGYYEFTGLAAGNYTLTETQPTAYLDGEETLGAVATLAGSSPVHDVITFAIPTGSETDSVGNDFGEINKGDISGYVHNDANLDGDYDGSGGLENVSVTITYTDDRSVGATQTLTTDSSGRFVFADLRPGTYTVTVDSGDSDLAGYLDGTERDDHNGVDSTTDYTIGTFAVAHGETEDDKWFGFNLPGSIAGFVIHDEDNDGVKDVGELGLAGAQMRLTGTTFEGDVITALIDTTDAAGFYEFTNLLPGTYNVLEQISPLGYIDGIDTAGDPAANTATNDLIANIVLSDGEDSTGNWFGELKAATLSGVVFNDFDGSGAQNGAEPGIENVTVTLTGTEELPDGSTAAITPIVVMTAADGTYTFTNLRPGTYTITETHPAAYTDGADAAGTLGGNTTVNDVISAIVVTSDDDGIGYAFAETGASIAGTVFRDDDRDGTLDGGEPRLSGVTIELYESDGTTFITSQATDGSGNYSFDDLAAADYVVKEIQPAGYTSSPAADTNTRNVTLVTGSDNTGNNFGEELWDLRGRLWFDRDADTINEIAEHGFDAVTVTLLYAGADGDFLTAGDNVTFTTDTNSNGDYSFTELLNGNYRVTIDTVDLPESVSNNVDPDGGTPSQSEFTIGGADITDHDYGYLGVGEISNQVWLDVDGDGIYEPGTEPGIPAITIHILFAGDDGLFGTSDDMDWVDVTIASGQYEFLNLPDGNYQVYADNADVNLPGGMTEVTVGDSKFGTVNITLDAADRIADDTDFGFVGQRTIGDVYWFDINGDGVKDANEPELGNVTIELQRTGFTNTFTVTTTTAADGTYSFDKLPEGNYVVTAIAGLPLDATATHDVDGTDDGTASFSIGASNRFDIDFGYRGSGVDGATISDFVWYDHDGDGVQDGGEPGIEGATVTLLFAGADNTFGNDDDFTLTDTTDVNGLYAFTNLFVGAYQVSVSAVPGSMNQTFHKDDGVGSIAEVSEISVIADQDRVDVDFGYTGTNNASGQVWLDRNANDSNGETNEPGIGGVTVELTYAGADATFGTADDLVITTTTDPSGNYTFNSLADGLYQVTSIANLPAGTTPTSGGGVGPDGIVDFAIAGSDVIDQDLGHVGTRTIGDRVWYDINDDGIQVGGEPGIVGVDLTILYYGADGNEASTLDNLTFNVTTGVNGIWSIDGLSDGDYSITVDTADLPPNLDGITLETDDFAAADDYVAHVRIAALDPAVRNDIDFGYTSNQTIGSKVWLDLDADGVVDAGEAGLGGVDVTIVWGGFDNDISTSGDNVTYMTVTDANGDYSVDRLPDGNYSVSLDLSDLPTGMTQTFEVDGSTDNDALIALTGTGNSGINFGYRGSATVGDLVYLDGEADGLQTGQDRGLTDIGVTLTYLGLDGTADGDDSEFTLNTTSGALGAYSFAFLPGGDFTIAVDTGDSDLPGDIAILNNGTGNAIGADETITLANGGTNNDVDFAFAGIRSIGDRIWYDRNDNTLDDGSEPGIVGVDLTLTYAGQDGAFGTVDDMTFTATTGAGGAYSFANAAEGDYRLAVSTASLPDTMRQTLEINDGADTLADTAEFGVSGANRGDIDFGYTGDGVISDQVWLDVNGDGIYQAATEPGLAGVTVTLLFAGDDGDFAATADNYTFTTDTDASGLYSFTKLPDGMYRVTPDVGDIPGSTTPTHDVDGTDDGVANITLTGSPNRTDVDFGFRGTRTMNGQVWLDRNSNNTNGETNEPGLGGVTVELTFAGKDNDFSTTGDNFVVTTVTDANGDYSFNNLADGLYRVTSTTGLPVGLDPTSGGGGPPDGIVDFSITGSNPGSQNLGHVGSSTISDLVWFDHDNNGIQNAGPVGLAGVQVTLVYTGADGIVDGDDDEFTLIVDSEGLSGTLGQYIFDNLPAGTFVVSIDTADIDLPVGLIPFASADSLNTTATVAVGTGVTNDTTDFGLRGTRAASGVVFFDGDADGSQAASNEDGFVGVTMSLLAAGQDGLFGTGDDFTLSVDTTTAGVYNFTNLVEGNYRVSVDTADIPGAETQTYDIDTTLDDRGDFTLAGSRSDIDFGYRGDSTISDLVWYDRNGDGSSVGEVGIPNQIVQAIFAGLDGSFSTADDLTFTTSTNASGLYSFDTMIDGNYRVSVPTPPTGMTNTAAPDDGVGTVPATSEISLGVSTTRDDVDLGFTGTGDVRGTVWFDHDADGIIDTDEPGIPGVDVQLEIDIDGDGLVDQTVIKTVGSDGTYSWTNLPAGSFTITVLTPPSGSAPTFDTDGLLTPNASDFVVPAGGSAPDQSFGYRGTGSISGDVIYDVNDNGVEDAGDRGQVGVDVTLEIDLDGDTVADLTRTVTTLADGSYNFTNLIAGTYSVTVDPTTLPDSVGDKPTFDVDGHVLTPDTVDVTVAAGANLIDQDFGYHGSPDLSVTITDMVTNVSTGQLLTYTIDVENLGTSRATGSELTVNLPISVLENIASTDPTAVVNIPAGTITFNIGEIGEGATLTKTLTAEVLDAVAAGINDVDVDALITDDGTHGVDDDPGNNDDTDTDIVDAVPDLRTEITAPPMVSPGDPVSYNVTIHNDGDQGATGVQGKTQIDILIIDPTTVVFEDSLGNPIPAADITFDMLTGNITWDAGTLASGDNAALVIKGDVYDPVLTLATNFEIDVIACNDGLNGEDPTDANDGPLDNNHREAFTVLNANPDYFVDVEIVAPADHTFQPRDTVTFTITAGNLGDQNGDNVEVITQLPMTLIDPSSVTISDPGVTFDPVTGEITWDMGSVIGRGLDIRTITVMATIPLVTGDPVADRIEFSSLVYDDGLNGADLVLANNQDLDGRELLQYAFDSNNNFLQKTGFDDSEDWYGYRDQPLRTTQPLPIDPIYSGLAEPGTTLLLKIFDEEGREIGSRSVVADAGGNWIASFPGAVVWEHPHAMTVETIGALHTLSEESQYNTRRYFQPALHPSMFFAPRPTVQSVMQDAPSQVMSAIHDANLRPLGFGSANHGYDLNVASNSTSSR